MAHHVKHHHWIDGVLETVEHFIEDLEEAIAHATESEAHTVKVYNAEGELVHVHVTSPETVDAITYA
jgi:hypothetical protein